MTRSFRSLSILPLTLLILSSPLSRLEAGGPIGAFGQIPIVWDVGKNGPVRLLLDRGSMAQHDSAATWEIIHKCTEAWDTISGSSLRIGVDGYLDYDVRVATDPYLIGAGTLSDGVVPVVIDDDGSITDAYIGVGASGQVNGFATPYTQDGRTWTDGRVVINGSRNRNENGFISTMTHEFGHLIGLSHNQRNHKARYALMNPFGGTLDEEDLLALLRLYAEDGVLDGRGSISGTITNAQGGALSGVNVLAINTESGEAYSTISDYFSGNDPRFGGAAVPRTGRYSFQGLPPGTYYIRMEGVDPEWDGGSSIASYDPPISSTLIDDWYNGELESGAMHIDDVNMKTGVEVKAGEDVDGIDLVENDITGLTKVGEVPSGTDRTWSTPNTFQGVRIGGYAVRHVAPENGSPVMTRIWVGTWPSINDGELIVTVYGNSRQQGFDLPGTVIGSLRIPGDQIVSNLNYDIWLHEISGLRFNKGDVFHIGLSWEGGNRMELQFVEDGSDDGTSYYESSDETWIPFPVEGNNNGTRSGRLKMETWFSPIRPGDNRVLVVSNPESVDFGSTEVGQVSKKSVTVANIGTSPMTVNDVVITGAGASAFRYDTATIDGITIAPGERRVVDLEFLPLNEGPASATLNIEGLLTVSIPMTGTGTSTAVGQLVAGIDFGQQLLDSARTIDTVVIYNRGGVALVSKAGGISGTGFRLLEPKSNGLFQPGDSLKVVVEFTPTQERDYAEELTFTFNPPRDTIRIAITGRGVREITSVPVVHAGDINLQVELLPNPANDHISLTISDPVGREVQTLLVDPLGRVVARPVLNLIRGGLRHAEIATGRLPSGAYRLVVVTGEGMVVRPVRIVR